MSFGTFRKFAVSKIDLDWSNTTLGKNVGIRPLLHPKTVTVSINAWTEGQNTKDPVKLEAIIKARLEGEYLYTIVSRGVKVVSFKWKEKN